MDPVKVIVFAVFFVLFVYVTRRLFSNETVYAQTQLPPQPQAEAAIAPRPGKPPAAVGSDFPLPANLPPRQLLPSGEYNRPEIRNYYFKTLDLVRGPDEPLCFCDEFYVEFFLPETGDAIREAISWTRSYLVATPAGLKKKLEADRHQSLIWGGMTIILPGWDIPSLLRTVIDDVVEDSK